MKVVSNTSPIINLAAIQQLEILHQLYSELFIPPAVYHEIVIRGAGQPGASEIPKSNWIVIQKIKNRSLLKALEFELDAGEAEAITLSVELEADLLLIDEKIGRASAARLDVRRIGVLGILLDAKKQGVIKQIKPLLNRLRIDAGFWIRPQLYQYILKLAHEK